MIPHNPIHEAEKFVKDLHDGAEKITRPVKRKYPLVFGFLIAFSASAIISGLNLIIKDIVVLNEHPILLVLMGSLVLLLTGKLYVVLEKK